MFINKRYFSFRVIYMYLFSVTPDTCPCQALKKWTRMSSSSKDVWSLKLSQRSHSLDTLMNRRLHFQLSNKNCNSTCVCDTQSRTSGSCENVSTYRDNNNKSRGKYLTEGGYSFIDILKTQSFVNQWEMRRKHIRHIFYLLLYGGSFQMNAMWKCFFSNLNILFSISLN